MFGGVCGPSDDPRELVESVGDGVRAKGLSQRTCLGGIV
jgi:hypothetical protein